MKGKTVFPSSPGASRNRFRNWNALRRAATCLKKSNHALSSFIPKHPNMAPQRQQDTNVGVITSSRSAAIADLSSLYNKKPRRAGAFHVYRPCRKQAESLGVNRLRALKPHTIQGQKKGALPPLPDSPSDWICDYNAVYQFGSRSGVAVIL